MKKFNEANLLQQFLMIACVKHAVRVLRCYNAVTIALNLHKMFFATKTKTKIRRKL